MKIKEVLDFIENCEPHQAFKVLKKLLKVYPNAYVFDPKEKTEKDISKILMNGLTFEFVIKKEE